MNRLLCRDCGHVEHDPGSCDALRPARYVIESDCFCDLYDDERGDLVCSLEVPSHSTEEPEPHQ